MACARDRRRGARPLDWAGYALIAVIAGGVAARRFRPVAAFTPSFAATLVFLLTGHPLGPVVQLTAVTAYSAGACARPRVSGAACLLALAAYLPLGALVFGTVTGADGVLVTLAWLVAPWGVGVGARAYRDARDRRSWRNGSGTPTRSGCGSPPRSMTWSATASP